MLKTIQISVMSAIGSSAHAEGQIVSIQDVNKTIVHQTPYTTEICRDYQTSGDKTGDTLYGLLSVVQSNTMSVISKMVVH